MPTRMCILALLTAVTALGTQAAVSSLDDERLQGLKWREIGPYRGGRSAAVAGIPQDRHTYYFGTTGGGVWKTQDSGQHWDNVSDEFFGGSIGSVAVSEWDPNVIYVGTGEKTVRGNVSAGQGVWKSTDAGRSWHHVGLQDSRHIPRMRIHPRNPDLVYAAVLGHLYGPNAERGVFRSNDGGRNWQKILFVNERVGAVDLILDPTNPRILYASMWRVRRTPYSLESGGMGSGLWKSTDSGDTWKELTDNKGLPKGPIGIIGIAVSPSNPDNLYAMIEAPEGGVFRSSDAGKTWQQVNQERKLRQRAWYYTRIYADPVDEESLYVLNVRFHRSKDGGKSFQPIATLHGDNHDLWIDPNDPSRMIESNDGGASVSEDGGANWSTQENQPTAQMYRVSTDNAFPYRLLGGQQDNSALRIRSRSAFASAIGVRDWDRTAGGESGHIVAKPDEPDVVYGGSYGGFLVRVDHRNGDRQAVNVWPDNPMGWGAAELKYRFNWNFPLFFSPHNPNRLYAAGNHLFVTEDSGHSWQTISPDLTRNEKSKQGASGGPITKDNTSVEYYGTIFAATESPVQAGVLWSGSDDGLVQLSRDGGQHWTDVTPRGLPADIQINSIEAHPQQAGGLYIAATAYKNDDLRPYLYKTLDYGRSWDKIVRGINPEHFTRSVRADPARPGLLFAGTEAGLYASFDDGAQWHAFQLNLPISPITDLAIKEGDLIAATQGRGYWILDDIALLQEFDDAVFKRPLYLFRPRPTYRLATGSDATPRHMGQNPPAGVVLRYHLSQELEPDTPMHLEILQADGAPIRRFTRTPLDASEREDKPETPDDDRILPTEIGLNEIVWNLRYPSAERFKGLVLWNNDTAGPKAVPGDYSARMTVGEESMQVSFQILPDPRLTISAQEFQRQFDFLSEVHAKISETHRAIGAIRSVRAQTKEIKKRIGDETAYQELAATADALIERLTAIEEILYQTKLESRQDPLNFPIRLNDKLAGILELAELGDHAPNAALWAVREQLFAAIDEQLQALNALWDEDLAQFNQQAHRLGLPLAAPPQPKAP